MAKPLPVDIYVNTKNGTIPYETLTQRGKEILAMKLNRQVIVALAAYEGYKVTFDNPLPEIGNE